MAGRIRSGRDRREPVGQEDTEQVTCGSYLVDVLDDMWPNSWDVDIDLQPIRKKEQTL